MVLFVCYACMYACVYMWVNVCVFMYVCPYACVYVSELKHCVYQQVNVSSKNISDFLHLNGSFVNIFSVVKLYICFCRTKLLSTVSNTLHIFICGGMKCQVSVLFIIFSAIFWKLHLILNWIIVTNEHKNKTKTTLPYTYICCT